jgi:hypothetical protein
VKLLAKQQQQGPFVPFDAGRQHTTPAQVNEHIQMAAVAMLAASIPTNHSATAGQRSSVPAAGVPWTVLLLRCTQLNLEWLQQALLQTADIQADRGSSSTASSSRAPQQQQQVRDSAPQELVSNVAKSLGQLLNALQIINQMLCSWFAGGQPIAEHQPPAAVLPLLQQCQQQL